MRSLDLQGHYSWELYLDIDNSESDGNISREETYTTSLYVSHKRLVTQVHEVIAKMDYSTSVGAKIDVIDVGVKFGSSLEAVTKLQETNENNSEIREERRITTTINVAGRSRLKLYQLVFNGPGISQKLDTLSSTPHNMEEVIISCSYTLKNFLSGVRVVYTDDAISKPDNSMEEVEGWNADINAGFGGQFVWLVPEWTTDSTRGITGIEAIVQDSENSDYRDLAKGAGGAFRYLKMMRSPNSRDLITKIRLWRTSDSNSKPSKFGWKNWSGDINRDRRGDYLYICWETTSV